VVKPYGKIKRFEAGETGHNVMYFCLDLCGAVNEVNCWKDALKSFGNAVANVVACSGFTRPPALDVLHPKIRP
jgi:hypothetical protein